MTAARANALSYPFSTDPAYKAGQDPAGDIADGLSLRARKGPSLDYYGTPDAPIELSTTGSGDAIYGDTLDVSDATWLHVEIMFFLQSDVAETENANLAVGLETSQDGVYWSPLPVINRASLISPATMFRNDTGVSATPSTTGGYAAAATTQNAPLYEDLTPILPATLTTTGDALVVQRALPFNVASALFVRVVFLPIYTEPPDRALPMLAARVNKAVSP